VAVWSSQCFAPLRLYEVKLSKKAPVVHAITIECEDQCSQDWLLDYVCAIESEYFYEFSGDAELHCKSPELGVIKAGSLMKFIITYTPLNLRERCAVLKVSNHFEEHVYEIKGSPLRSTRIELERAVTVQQG
jgi:hypothetical protein